MQWLAWAQLALSILGTFGGAYIGIVTSAKLTAYRLEQLEKKVEVHNNFAQRVPVVEERVKTLFTELGELKEEVRK